MGEREWARERLREFEGREVLTPTKSFRKEYEKLMLFFDKGKTVMSSLKDEVQDLVLHRRNSNKFES